MFISKIHLVTFGPFWVVIKLTIKAHFKTYKYTKKVGDCIYYKFNILF